MNIIKHLVIVISFFTSFFPKQTFAQVTGTSRLYEMLVDFRGLLNYAVPIIFGLAMIYFFWGTANFILKDAGNEKTRRDGINKMIWGVIVIFVFVSIWGILNTLSTLIGL
ncbi:MAG TPA: hypothetical protein PLZ99_02500 [Parcubacteria group bacterium]|jgi:hypothetical protein|nr:hypothetical protein [Parcubacteria group bacterium]